MTTAAREKFSSQAAPDVLAAMRQIAESQGRQFQAVLDEALRDYIERQQKDRPRRHVMVPAYQRLALTASANADLCRVDADVRIGHLRHRSPRPMAAVFRHSGRMMQ